ncbi:hypothetical protein [Pontibacter rugosus]
MSDTRFIPCTVADLHTLQDIAINSYGDHYLYLWFDGGMWYIDRSFSDAALKKSLVTRIPHFTSFITVINL